MTNKGRAWTWYERDWSGGDAVNVLARYELPATCHPFGTERELFFDMWRTLAACPVLANDCLFRGRFVFLEYNE